MESHLLIILIIWRYKLARRKKPSGTKINVNSHNTTRKKNTKEQKKLFLLACEGSKTEPKYFKAFFAHLIENLNISKKSLVIAKHDHTDPMGVLTDLLLYEEDYVGNYKNFDEVWIVIDRDEERTGGGGHTITNFNDAISKAKKEGVRVAYSNPSFELWYLLHFDYCCTPIHRDEVVKKVKSKLGSYEKSDDGVFKKFLSQQDTAIRNAENLMKKIIDEKIGRASCRERVASPV